MERNASTVSLSRSTRSSFVDRLRSRADVKRHVTTAGTQKESLLLLKLTSPSFIDSVVHDDATKLPLYVFDTSGTSTTINRTDPWQGVHKVADIKWPKFVPVKLQGTESSGVLVQVKGGRWSAGEELLRPSTAVTSSSRKFNVPGYSQPLKWKKVGKTYWCVTNAVTGPIAILHPTEGVKPARIRIYETLHDKQDKRPLMSHNGVSTLLLDYLIVTATILVTDIQEWMVVKKYDGKTTAITPPAMSISQPQASPSQSSSSKATSDQWRKIAYGEPLFKKRSTASASSSSSRAPSPSRASSEDLSFIDAGESFANTSPQSPDTSIASSFNEDDTIRSPVIQPPPLVIPSELSPSRNSGTNHQASPSAESILYPLSPSSAPSHTYIDPSFYNPNSAPPVPPIPSHLVIGRGRSETTSSAPNSATMASRRLPMPPSQASTSAESSRAHSTPPRDRRSYVENSSSRPQPQRSVTGGRQLPAPPLSLYTSREDLRHAASVSNMLRVKRQSTYGRTLPPTPSDDVSGGIDTVRKSEESEWMINSGRKPNRQTVFDMPPPAYNTINFSVPSPATEVRPSLPVPPLPPVPQTPTLMSTPQMDPTV